LKFFVDNLEQSVLELTDELPMKTNIFIGAELTPKPNNDYPGEINDVSNRDCSLIFFDDFNHLDHCYEFRSNGKTS
jgi:hypothetical protein